MTPLSVVIARIKQQQPTYLVEEAKGNEQELPDGLGKPKITVGYGPVRNSRPETIVTYDLEERNGDNLVQSFYVKIICNVSDFRAVFVNVYKALSAYNPNLPNEPSTAFCYTNGEPLGISNDTFWFVSEWKINFPTNTLLQ